MTFFGCIWACAVDVEIDSMAAFINQANSLTSAHFFPCYSNRFARSPALNASIAAAAQLVEQL